MSQYVQNFPDFSTEVPCLQNIPPLLPNSPKHPGTSGYPTDRPCFEAGPETNWLKAHRAGSDTVGGLQSCLQRQPLVWGRGRRQPGSSWQDPQSSREPPRRRSHLGLTSPRVSDLQLFSVNAIISDLQQRSQQETSGYFLFNETQFDFKSSESPGGQHFSGGFQPAMGTSASSRSFGAVQWKLLKSSPRGRGGWWWGGGVGRWAGGASPFANVSC